MILVRDFKRDRRPQGGRDFAPRDDRPQTMFKAICSDCGKECEVPFKPNGSKPVFCRECFQGKRRFEGPKENNFAPRKPNFDDRGTQQGPPPPPPHREDFAALNAKLDRIINLLTVKPEVKDVVVAKPEKMAEVKVEKKVAKVKKAPVVKKKATSKK
jgi:CxxC-x17-CxxC domain-containing protein